LDTSDVVGKVEQKRFAGSLRSTNGEVDRFIALLLLLSSVPHLLLLAAEGGSTVGARLVLMGENTVRSLVLMRLLQHSQQSMSGWFRNVQSGQLHARRTASESSSTTSTRRTFSAGGWSLRRWYRDDVVAVAEAADDDAAAAVGAATEATELVESVLHVFASREGAADVVNRLPLVVELPPGLEFW